MSIRADFYIGRGNDAEWLGSIRWEGNPENINTTVLEATTESEYRRAIIMFFNDRNDVIQPEQGWPWPWNDSSTTDFAYAFDGSVYYSIGYPVVYWWKYSDGLRPSKVPAPFTRCEQAVFPNMSQKRLFVQGE